MATQEIFEKLKENTKKMKEILVGGVYEVEHEGFQSLLEVLNERNQLFEYIYNTKFTTNELDIIESIIEQNREIESLIETKKEELKKRLLEFQHNTKKIMKYLGG